MIRTRTVADLKGGYRKGEVKLLAKGGTATVSGTLDSSAPDGGDGGFIETSGDKVKILAGAVVTTKAAAGISGTWLIDPTDFTISAGDAPQTESGIGADTLMENLNCGGCTVAIASPSTSPSGFGCTS